MATSCGFEYHRPHHPIGPRRSFRIRSTRCQRSAQSQSRPHSPSTRLSTAKNSTLGNNLNCDPCELSVMLFSNSCHISPLLANVVGGVQRTSGRIFISCFHSYHTADAAPLRRNISKRMIECCLVQIADVGKLRPA